jgi:hypothetical protein
MLTKTTARTVLTAYFITEKNLKDVRLRFNHRLTLAGRDPMDLQPGLIVIYQKTTIPNPAHPRLTLEFKEWNLMNRADFDEHFRIGEYAIGRPEGESPVDIYPKK